MKACQLDSFDIPPRLSIRELPEPCLKSGEVLVCNYAAGINPIDWKTCQGGGARPFIEPLPFIPGWEFAGEIESVWDDRCDFNSGDRVFGMIRFPKPAGCFAEKLSAPTDQITRIPPAMSYEEAAGLALAGQTAWQALFSVGRLQPGERVLVLAAAGGVGHLAVQLARWKGAEVVGTASAANFDFLRELGCQEVIDYHGVELESQCEPVDLIIDGVGGKQGIHALACLKPGGRLVSLPSITLEQVQKAGEQLGHRVLGLRVSTDTKQMEQLAQLCTEGLLRVEISARYPLHLAAEALEVSARGHTRRKIVLTT